MPSRTGALDQNFWSQFAERYWEKNPLVIRQPFVRPLLTSEQLFRGLVRASRARQETDRNIRFYNEQALQEAEVDKYLPKPSDHSLGGYVARVSRQIGGRRSGLIAHQYHLHDARAWLSLREFLHGCYKVTGSPMPWSEATVFVANYDKTPFGVHRDDHSTFLFVVKGTKRILAWPAERFRHRRQVASSLDYERYRRSAITLEGKPGDVLYWPKSYWHVAESTGGLSVTLHLPIFPELDAGRDLAQHVARIVDVRLNSLDGTDLYSVRPAALQEAATRAGEVRKQIVDTLHKAGDSVELADALRVVWLKRLTSGGFHSVPPPRPHTRLTNAAIVRGDPRFPIIWLRHKGEIVCAANGHCFSVNAKPGVLKLVARINSGAPFRIRVAANDALPAKDTRAFLEKLLSLRAITKRTTARTTGPNRWK